MAFQMTPELANLMKTVSPEMIQKAQRIARMVQMGADLKSVVGEVRKAGFSPQIAEQFLCAASPQFKQLKQMFDQSGMTPVQFVKEMAKQNNYSQDQAVNTYNELMSAVQ